MFLMNAVPLQGADLHDEVAALRDLPGNDLQTRRGNPRRRVLQCEKGTH